MSHLRHEVRGIVCMHGMQVCHMKFVAYLRYRVLVSREHEPPERARESHNNQQNVNHSDASDDLTLYTHAVFNRHAFHLS